MKLLVISLEFEAGTFSGNGVYCQTQVQALSRLDHQILVISGAPMGSPEIVPDHACASTLLQVPLPQWGTLDSSCSHEDFAEAFHSPKIAELVDTFRPEAVLGVDWHAAKPYSILHQSVFQPPMNHSTNHITSSNGRSSQCAARHVPFIFLNYRIHSRTDAGCLDAEMTAFEMAALSVVLCNADKTYALKAFGHSSPIKVLLPPLRDDLAVASTYEHADELALPSRFFVTCAVRCSSEKEPERFVELVEAMASSGRFPDNLKPLVCGGGWNSDAGKKLVSRLIKGLPATVVHTEFLGPAELADIYRQTALNIHPCSHDAYGMTIVEAASFGAPSLVQEGGAVGATDLLSSEAGEVFGIDYALMSMDALAGYVCDLLVDTGRLHSVGSAARVKAVSYTTTDNARQLAMWVEERIVAVENQELDHSSTEI